MGRPGFLFLGLSIYLPGTVLFPPRVKGGGEMRLPRPRVTRLHSQCLQAPLGEGACDPKKQLLQLRGPLEGDK